ncbi:MAG: LysE family translocator [Paludibacteraceae bacterium]|nr:LysE family translocator [Paludibacteraceae bacterium]MBP5137082.1 LysE family translocator [Paludibacteraceae bacterium]MBP5742745.1 LysE family translocator [Paludibacteraceae bacterium]
MNIVLTGILLGIFISIPVGPIAVLCIQRTLDRGKYHGWITGLGASLSDVLYSTLAVYGLSFVVDFIQTHQFFIEIIGAVVIFLFGYFLFRSNPSVNLTANREKKESYLQDFVTAFAITISNPLIIFLFIPLFAQFDFVTAEASIDKIAIAMFAVFVGGALWWFALTSVVNLFRRKINVRGLGLINRISGGILMGLAVFGLFAAIAHEFL